MNDLFQTENAVLNPELIQKLNDLYDQGRLQVEAPIKVNKLSYSLPDANAGKILDASVINTLKQTGTVLAYNHEKNTFETLPIELVSEGTGTSLVSKNEGTQLKVKSIKGLGGIKINSNDKEVLISDTPFNDSEILKSIKSLEINKAPKSHDHPLYASKTDVKLLGNEIKIKADKNHDHKEYAHKTDLKVLKAELSPKPVDLSAYAKKTDLKPLVERKELTGLAKVSDLGAIVKESIKLNKNINEELRNFSKKDHSHDNLLNHTHLKELESKIPKDFATKKDIADLDYEKANLIHGHNTGQISGLSETLSGLGTTYLKIDGSNHMEAPLGINTAPRAGSVLDILSSDTGTIGNVSTGSITFNYGAGGYYNESLSFEYDVYAYRDFPSGRVYSATAKVVTGTDNGNSDSIYNITLSWGEVTGADGYRVVVMADNYYGASGNFYFDMGGTSATIGRIDVGYVTELTSYYTSGTPTVTPTSTAAGSDFYLDKAGDLHSTGDFYFGNFPTLSLGNDNGLTLTGGHAKVLSIPTTANVNLGGISLKAGRVPTGNHIVFPQGYGGASSPGIRFEGGQTDGGLAMDDGILEFWNNFSRYVTPVGGRLQAVFRIDTRTGYESEGFIVGGSSPSGTGAVAIGVNFNTFDVNLNYYGYGSTCVGTDVGSAGISGNGHLGVKYDFYAGRDIIVNSTGGMKIGTATTQKIGFYNATPIVQPSAYTITNPSTDRAFDVSSTSVNELAAVLGTLIGDLKSLGLIG